MALLGNKDPGKYGPLAGTEATGRRTVCSRVHDIHNIHYFLHILGSQARWFGWVGVQDSMGV
jgi:hypothetical protein